MYLARATKYTFKPAPKKYKVWTFSLPAGEYDSYEYKHRFLLGLFWQVITNWKRTQYLCRSFYYKPRRASTSRPNRQDASHYDIPV